MIVPGTKPEANWGSGNWIFLDIGFASRRPTCGLAFGEEAGSSFCYGEMRVSLCEHIRSRETEVNLVIEAPLSVCFDEKGNPKGRAIEKQDSRTRYWFAGLGCAVTTAALYVVRDIYDSKPKATVRLFEGFVSFKDGSSDASDHCADVEALRRVIRQAPHRQDSIFSKDQLLIETTDTIQSAFKVAGLDFGVPAVIVAGSD